MLSVSRLAQSYEYAGKILSRPAAPKNSFLETSSFSMQAIVYLLTRVYSKHRACKLKNQR